jgi:hypothetical protein
MSTEKIIAELIDQASGLMAASDGVQSPFLRVRMLKAAETMMKAARRLEKGQDNFIPEFIKKEKDLEVYVEIPKQTLSDQ